uniref:UBC core domain-containing protein n=1 Tax=Tetradesmus obliquus TaxID=3088 RepID=A0A383WFP1_TETOB|eukprot:jgi/Sobl393_1/10428/SZX78259.1
MAAANPAKFNLRNPAVKRIMQEIKEMQGETCADFMADALEDDIFEWHFVVRGPPDTEFEGGIYHGRILLPSEYPFKPPSFMMLTPNGRFQTGVKVCLSISSHHPEHWQPSWSVRTALTALIAFMPTPGQGALGSLDFTKDERQQLAVKSRTEVPKFGSAARQKVINEMHQRMLTLQQQQEESSSSKAAGAAAAAAASPAGADSAPAAAAAGSDQEGSKQQQQQQQDNMQAMQEHPAAVQQQQLQDAVSSSRQDNNKASIAAAAAGGKKPAAAAAAGAAATAAASPATPVASAPAAAAAAAAAPAAAPAVAAAPLGHPVYVAARAGSPATAAAGGGAVGSRPGELPADRGLTFLAVVLSVAIAAMLLKKVMTAMGGYRLLV